MSDPRDLVDEMIGRLRQLQGSGEYPPLTRKVEAGEGLAGGGTLEEDLTLSLDPDLKQTLEELGDRDPTTLITQDDLTEAIKDFVTQENLPARVIYRDFTVTDAPISQVTAPPIRADEDCTITRVTVVAASPGSQPVTVAVAGQTVTVPEGVESITEIITIARTAGQSIPVTVNATDASDIVISLRIEETPQQ